MIAYIFKLSIKRMLINHLDITFAGILASLNFAGYLSGSLLSIFIKDINQKVLLFRFGVVLAISSTLALAFSSNDTIWIIARIFAGFAGAMTFVVGSAIVMTKLQMESKTKAMGIHFSGIGFSILTTDLINRYVLSNGGTWQDSWLVLSIFAFVISIYSVYILSFDKKVKQNVVKHGFDKSIFTFFVILIISCVILI